MSEDHASHHGTSRDRKMRNYLLDSRFQLKFAGYFVAVTLVIAGLLGALLIRTTDSLFAQIAASVESRKNAADTSRELGNCTLNNELTRNIENPEFAAKLAERSKGIDAAYDAERTAAQEQSLEVKRQQRLTLYGLLGVLVAFIALIALTAIVITHRIVGPLFRIKRMALQVAQGVLTPPPYALRPTDELQEVFSAFALMMKQLRASAEADLTALKSGDPGELKKLEASLELRLRQPDSDSSVSHRA